MHLDRMIDFGPRKALPCPRRRAMTSFVPRKKCYWLSICGSELKGASPARLKRADDSDVTIYGISPPPDVADTRPLRVWSAG